MHNRIADVAKHQRLSEEGLIKFAKDNPRLGAYVDDAGELWISNWFVDTLITAYKKEGPESQKTS